MALLCAFFGAAILRESPLKPIQLLWVNLIMDSLASLALATEPPDHEKLLNRPPHGRKESLITRKMIKFITITVIAQTIIMFGILFYGPILIPEDIDDIQIH